MFRLLRDILRLANKATDVGLPKVDIRLPKVDVNIDNRTYIEDSVYYDTYNKPAFPIAKWFNDELLDDFGEVTGNLCASYNDPTGFFSDEYTSRGELNVYLQFFADGSIGISLYCYGDYQTTLDPGEYYTVLKRRNSNGVDVVKYCMFTACGGSAVLVYDEQLSKRARNELITNEKSRRYLLMLVSCEDVINFFRQPGRFVIQISEVTDMYVPSTYTFRINEPIPDGVYNNIR